MSTEDVIKIVVGVDFEAQGDHALDEAIRYVAKIEHDELHPVFVIREWDRADVGKVNAAIEQAQEKLRARVVQRCEQVRHKWEQDIIFHVRLGEPAEVIHQVAIDVDAHLIVVGTHGRKGLEKMIVGSVAEKLVREAHLPVMVARPRELDALEKTPQPEDARPGEELHNSGARMSERISFTGRTSHISGLV